MEETTEEVKTIVCRWPAELVERIDVLAAADERYRNNWLLVKVRRLVEDEEARA